MPLTFTSPLLLAGLAAIAVPVLVHLVQRMERSGHAFPSLMFVSRTPFQARRRKTLRDRFLLALRCLAIALLALAFAGPELTGSPLAGTPAASARDTVVLIDRSYSMDQPARWQAVIEEAGGRIDALAAGARMALVAFDNAASLIAPLTDDRRLLRERLGELEPGGHGTRLAGGIDLAGRVLRESSIDDRRIVLISDLQRSALAAVDRLFLEQQIAFEISPVDAPVRTNAAVMSASLVPSEADGGGPLLDIRIRSTGTDAFAGAEVAVEIDGRTTHRERLDLAAGEEQSLRVPVALALDRASAARIVLGEDELTADNEYHLMLMPDPPVEVALLTSAAGPGSTDPAVFLRQALQVASEPAIRVTNRESRAGQAPALTQVDVLIADDAALRDDAVRQGVQRFVRRGGGLLLLMADRNEPDMPGSASPGLPRGLGDLRRHADPGLDVALATNAGGHPVWERAGADIAAALAGTRIRLSRHIDPSGGEVLARLGDGAPWLVERRVGAGGIIVMTSGLTRAWGNLALEPGFVPLLHELVRYLAQRPPVAAAHVLGDVIDLQRLAANSPGAADWQRYLDAGGGVVVDLPEGGRRRLTDGEPLYRTRQAGVHEVHRAGGGAPPLHFAVNADRSESLLASASASELTQRISRRPEPQAGALDARTPETRTPLGWYLLAAALALLWLESQVANRLSSARAGG